MLKKIFCLSLFSFLGLVGLNAQSIDVQLEGLASGCDSGQNQYCVSIQVRSIDGADFLGSSSIRLSYDGSVLFFAGSSFFGVTNGSYTSVNFDDDNSTLNPECGSFTPYSAHGFDGNIPGQFLVTFVLEDPTIFATTACPNIANDWEEVSIICFDVLDAVGNPDLQVAGTQNGPVTDLTGTNFNDDTDDPTMKYDNGTFTGLTIPFDVVCATPSCPFSLYVPGPVASATYEAENDVNSDGAVDNNATVIYQAGNYVDLLGDFDVPLGADFTAQIQSCVP